VKNLNETKKLAIEAILKRITQLEQAILNCPLCEKFGRKNCKGCPAENADYDCATYIRDIRMIWDRLEKQLEKFRRISENRVIKRERGGKFG